MKVQAKAITATRREPLLGGSGDRHGPGPAIAAGIIGHRRLSALFVEMRAPPARVVQKQGRRVVSILITLGVLISLFEVVVYNSMVPAATQHQAAHAALRKPRPGGGSSRGKHGSEHLSLFGEHEAEAAASAAPANAHTNTWLTCHAIANKRWLWRGDGDQLVATADAEVPVSERAFEVVQVDKALGWVALRYAGSAGAEEGPHHPFAPAPANRYVQVGPQGAPPAHRERAKTFPAAATFPTYRRGAPLPPRFDRVLSVGDASAVQQHAQRALHKAPWSPCPGLPALVSGGGLMCGSCSPCQT